MATYSNTAREVEMPNGDVVVIHSEPTGGANTTSNIKKFKYDDNGHVTESTAADAEDLNLSGYSTPTTGTTAIGTSDDVQTAIGKLDHQSHIDQTNILYALGKTGKNLFEFTAEGLKQRWDSGTWNGNTFNSNFGVTIVVNDNKSIVVTGTPNTQTSLTLGIYDHTKYKGCVYSGGTSNVSTNTCISGVNNIGYDYGDGVTMTGDTDRAIQIAFFTGTNLNITFKPMICTAEDWAVGHDFAPYALPNYDLTRLESEDRASLAEVVDSGAKNLLDEWNEVAKRYGATGNTIVQNGITYTYSNGSITISGTATAKENFFLLQDTMLLSNGNYVVSWRSKTINAIKTSIKYLGLSYAIESTDSVIELPKRTDSSSLWITIPNGTTVSGTIDIMICTKAAFGVSQKFVPYTRKQPRIIYKTASPTLSDTETIVTDLNYTIPANVTARITVTQAYNNAIPTAIRIAWDNAMIPSHTYAYVENSNNIGLLSTSVMTTPNTATTLYISAKAAQSGSNNIYMLIELFE